MSKFKFNRKTDDTLNVRISKETADKIRAIAKQEKLSIQEVCREFLTVAVKEYLEDSL
jgi:predicted HicB family RNase H-like nuclease